MCEMIIPLYLGSGQLLGVGYSPHPAKFDYFLGVTFYRTAEFYAVCLSEGRGPPHAALREQKLYLGQTFPEQVFEPFLKTLLPRDLPLVEVQHMAAVGFPETTFVWAE